MAKIIKDSKSNAKEFPTLLLCRDSWKSLLGMCCVIGNYCVLSYVPSSLGYLICLDVFLSMFCLMPLRSLSAIFSLIFRPRTHLSLVQKVDLIKFSMVILCCILLMQLDASRLYHSIRGQAVIKLYVIFNVLEVLFAFLLDCIL